MTSRIYSQQTESFRSRIQNQLPEGPTISAAPVPRTTYTVRAADGESIEIPLALLSDIAAIEVDGEAPDRPGPVEFHYTVHINNSATLDSIGQHKLNHLAVEEELDRASRAVKGGIYKHVAETAMDRTGLEKKLAGKVRDMVHNPLHQAASKVGRRAGVSGTSTTRMVRYVSKIASETAAKQVGVQAAKGVLGFIFGKGIGAIGMILEADETGYSVVKYGESKERRFPVVFYITGKPSSGR